MGITRERRAFLQRMERLQDEATLEFWEALMWRDQAKARLRDSEQKLVEAQNKMYAAKTQYLEEKLNGTKP